MNWDPQVMAYYQSGLQTAKAQAETFQNVTKVNRLNIELRVIFKYASEVV